MKKLFICLFTVCCALSTSSVYAQTDTLRNCGVRIITKKDVPVRDVLLSTTVSTEAFMTDKDGRAIATNVTDADSLIAFLPEIGRVSIPFNGLDSILITVKSAKKYVVRDANHDTRTRAVNSFENVPELLKSRPVRSVSELLQGLVPGLRIGYDSSTGEASANIRGMNSIYGSSEPLVVVDGMMFDSISAVDGSVDVRTIQSIEVQKDGNMYGMRGANGVIIIRTIGFKSQTL